MKPTSFLAPVLALVLSLFTLSAASQETLLIIAPDEFITSLEPLRQFKECTARPTILLSLSQVYSGFSGGVDTPERIKNCIAHYKKLYDIKYVMLVGDCDKFPVRYLCRDVPIPRGYQPSDFYYADLFKSDGSFDNWDGNGNRLYAQMLKTSTVNNVDSVDWHPDVAVARVPASTPAEVCTYVKKVITYEVDASNSAWFKRALLVTGCKNCGDAIGTKDYIASHCLSDFATKTYYHTTFELLYPVPKCEPPPCSQQVFDSVVDQRAAPITTYLNQGTGFFNYFGHGNQDSFAWVYDDRHLDDLANEGKLPVIFSTGCSTAEFAPSAPWQDYTDTSNVFHENHGPHKDETVPTPKPVQPGAEDPHNCDLESRPEAWLVKRETGAIAYGGSAGTGHPGYGEAIDKAFFTAYQKGYRVFGDMWYFMVNRILSGWVDQSGNMTGNEWNRCAVWNTLTRYNAFGDPSLVVGGAFTNTRSGDVWDSALPWTGGPWLSFTRYSLEDNVTVPVGYTLTAFPYASILFKNGKKLRALGSGPNEGFVVNATSTMPVYLISVSPDPQIGYAFHGIKVGGQLRVQDGGEIKLY